MFRRGLREGYGMLFVFPAPEVLHFYMKNTLVPLSIAFIRADGRIETISGMQPHDLNLTSSQGPCQYALEMPPGWFSDHKVWEGTRVVIPDDVKADD